MNENMNGFDPNNQDPNWQNNPGENNQGDPQNGYQQDGSQQNGDWSGQNYGQNYYQQPPQYQQPPYQQPQYQQPQGYYKQYYDVPPVGYQQKSRLGAGILGVMFGMFGVHNFYLGNNTRGVIQLVVSLAGGLLTCGVATAAMEIWGIVEGIQLIIGGDDHKYDGNGVIMRD